MTNEAHELARRVLETDISVNNPGIQNIIEREIGRWVESYSTKKEIRMSDCYGGPGEIPDEIEIDGQKYSPEQILEHVRARDETGRSVLEKVYNEHSVQNATECDPREAVADILAHAEDLDKFVVYCSSGHNKTYRDIAFGVINAGSDSVLNIGWPDAIMKLYEKKRRISRQSNGII